MQFSKEIAFIDNSIIELFYNNLAENKIGFIGRAENIELLTGILDGIKEPNKKLVYIFFYSLVFSDLKDRNSIKGISMDQPIEENGKKIYVGGHSILLHKGRHLTLSAIYERVSKYLTSEILEKYFLSVSSFEELLGYLDKLTELIPIEKGILELEENNMRHALIYLDFFKNLNALKLKNTSYFGTSSEYFSDFKAADVVETFDIYAKNFSAFRAEVLEYSRFKHIEGLDENFGYIFEDFLCFYHN